MIFDFVILLSQSSLESAYDYSYVNLNQLKLCRIYYTAPIKFRLMGGARRNYNKILYKILLTEVPVVSDFLAFDSWIQTQGKMLLIKHYNPRLNNNLPVPRISSNG